MFVYLKEEFVLDLSSSVSHKEIKGDWYKN